MSDLIDRDFAIKALDSAIDDFDDYHENYGIERAQDIISCLPSAQTTEVIRCKDCKHRPTSTEADGHIEQGFSLEFPDNVCPCQCEDGWYNWYPSDDFYCANAEGREE